MRLNRFWVGVLPVALVLTVGAGPATTARPPVTAKAQTIKGDRYVGLVTIVSASRLQVGEVVNGRGIRPGSVIRHRYVDRVPIHGAVVYAIRLSKAPTWAPRSQCCVVLTIRRAAT
jgi:hypothetical protein